MKLYLKILFFMLCIILNADAIKPLIKNVHVDGATITVTPHEDFVDQFLRKSTCKVTYNYPVDLTELPQSILVIPFIMTAAPFIWASGEHYTIGTLDEDTALSLKKAQHALKLLYPSCSWSGSLTIKKTITRQSPTKLPKDHMILFFSGGLDSMCSSFSHLDKKQLLVTFRGLDVQLNEVDRWQKVQTWCQNFADKHNHTLIDLSFNFNSMFRADVASKLVPGINDYVDWWGSIMLGLSYMGLITPLAYALGHHTVFIGSSSTIDHPEPEGTCPLIDNNLKCAGIQLVHDGADMTRPEKIAHIAHQAQCHGIPLPALRVCQTDKQGKNCTFCWFKCLMTVHNILAAGQNPTDFDFIDDLKKIYRATEEFFAPGRKIAGGKLWEWKCSQDYARKALTTNSICYQDDVKDYLKWFCSLNLDEFLKDDGGEFDRNKEWWTLLWKQGYIKDDAALFALEPRPR